MKETNLLVVNIIIIIVVVVVVVIIIIIIIIIITISMIGLCRHGLDYTDVGWILATADVS